MKCNARDARGDRCRIVGDHKVARNSKGELAACHETPHSVWLVALR